MAVLLLLLSFVADGVVGYGVVGAADVVVVVVRGGGDVVVVWWCC